MCLIVFGWRVHPRYTLVLAGNRDEFLARPSAAAHWWTPQNDILAGRDLQAGGTWMGINRRGHLAALTNYRGPNEKRAAAPSRGALVADFLGPATDIPTYLTGLGRHKALYNGFNLLLGAHLGDPDRAALWLDSNRDPSAPCLLQPGCYGVSNALLDTPWPKLVAAREAMRDLIHQDVGEEALMAGLFALLGDRAIVADERLPATGVPLELERGLSAAHIDLPGYGTRATTVVLVDRSGSVRFRERSRQDDGRWSEVDHRFDLAS